MTIRFDNPIFNDGQLLDWAEFSEQLPDSGIPVSITCCDGCIEAQISQESDLTDLPSYGEVKQGIEALDGMVGIPDLDHFRAAILYHLGVFVS